VAQSSKTLANYGVEPRLARGESAFVVVRIQTQHHLLGQCIAQDRVRQPIVQRFGLENRAEGLLHPPCFHVRHGTAAIAGFLRRQNGVQTCPDSDPRHCWSRICLSAPRGQSREYRARGERMTRP